MVWKAGKCGKCLLVLGCLGLAGSLVATFVIKKMVEKGVHDYITMTPGSTSYQSWLDTSVPGSAARYYNMYFYNLTNPVEFLNGLEKPKLRQVGPFRYRQYQKNLNITFSDDMTELQYYPWEWFSSINDDSTPITTLNLPMQAMVQLVKLNPLFKDFDVALFYWDEKPQDVMFTTRPAHELLFGYTPPKLDFIKFPGLSRNGTVEYTLKDGFSKMMTGKNDTSVVRQHLAWKGQEDVYCCVEGTYPDGLACSLGWNDPQANRVKGTGGDQFHPFVQPGETLEVFVDVIFRSAHIQNAPGPDQWVSPKGVPMLKFTIPPYVLENATEVPGNAGYWEFGPDGLINVTTCALHMPTFLSKPHFLDADPSLRDDVIFLDEPAGPVDAHRDIWDTYINVEPITGISMDAAERLQINIEVGPIPNFDLSDPLKPALGFPNMPRVKLPVVWLEKAAELTDEQATYFRWHVVLPFYIGKWGWLGCIVSAVIVLAAAAWMYCTREQSAAEKRSRSKHKRHAGHRGSRDELESLVDGVPVDDDFVEDTFTPVQYSAARDAPVQYAAAGHSGSMAYSPAQYPLVTGKAASVRSA